MPVAGLNWPRQLASGRDARVVSCQVLAPTEWNFHPQGAVAQALENLCASRPGVDLEVDLLISAYDPCVKHEIVSGHAPACATDQAEHCHA